MWTREAIEQVLNNHTGFMELCRYPRVPSDPPALIDFTKLIYDLLALAPPPTSREVLKELLRRFHNDQDRMTEPDWIEQWIGRFMSLAAGQTERRWWCEHITSTTFMGKSVWVYQATDVPNGVVFGMDFEQCPLCGATRPQEPS